MFLALEISTVVLILICIYLVTCALWHMSIEWMPVYFIYFCLVLPLIVIVTAVLVVN